jgi:hypothetical protein
MSKAATKWLINNRRIHILEKGLRFKKKNKKRKKKEQGKSFRISVLNTVQ